MIFRPAFASIVCALLAGRAYAQIEKPTESELDAAPKQFQALVHGKSKFITPINQGFSGKGNIRPPDAVPVVTIPNPSHDPRDFTGYWYDPDAPGGQLPGGGVPVPLADAPPGLVRTTKIDAERLCIVDLGPEPWSTIISYAHGGSISPATTPPTRRLPATATVLHTGKAIRW